MTAEAMYETAKDTIVKGSQKVMENVMDSSDTIY